MKLLSELVYHISIDASGEWSRGVYPCDVALPWLVSIILRSRLITEITNVPTRPARELHPGGDSYVVHYNSFLGHHHDDDLIRSNIGTNLGTDSGEDQEAACAPVDCNTDRGCLPQHKRTIVISHQTTLLNGHTT